MPQILLEYTDNISERPDFKMLLLSLHFLLQDLASAELAACKSRVKELTNYCIGDGGEQQAFVHLSIGLLAGRSQEVKDQVGNAASQLLQKHFQNSYGNYATQISVQILEMPKELYFKVTI